MKLFNLFTYKEVRVNGINTEEYCFVLFGVSRLTDLRDKNMAT